MDWNHIWLSEGFATYFTHIYNEFNYGRDRLVEGMERDRTTVIRFLAENPDLPLVPPEYDDPNRMLNRNAYQKGGWTLHMLRRQVGEEAFFAGVRDYYETYRDGNALTEDFQGIMERASGQDLTWFFHQWAYVAGHPVLEGEWEFDAASGELSLSLRQVQPRDHVFRFPLDIGVRSRDGSVELLGTVEVTKGAETFTLPISAQPTDIILDPHTLLLFEGGLTRG
jgi:aminopeptidase N